MVKFKPKINQEKTDAVEAIKEYISSTKDMIFADYRGLNVEQITRLRIRLRENASRLKVIKNNYMKIAINALGLPDISDMLVGPTAIASVNNDIGPVAKIFFDYSKDTTLQIKGGIIDGKIFSKEDIKAISRLPAKNELIAILMRAIYGPLQGMVYALNGVTQKLARTLQAVVDKKSKDEK
jgi:large subunit ribosomal protein L10